MAIGEENCKPLVSVKTSKNFTCFVGIKTDLFSLMQQQMLLKNYSVQFTERHPDKGLMSKMVSSIKLVTVKVITPRVAEAIFINLSVKRQELPKYL